MATYCTSCGAALPSEVRFCGSCGAAVINVAAQTPPPEFVPPIVQPAVQPTSVFEDEAPSASSAKWWIGGGIGLALALGLIYYFAFRYHNEASAVGTPTVQVAPVASEPAKQFYTVTEANIRDKATATGSNIIGKLPRGSTVSGKLASGVDGISNWLELPDGKGFIGAVNLSETQPPVLTKLLSDKIWAADKAIDIWMQPEGTSNIIDHVAAGTKLTLVGLTANDYIEIKLQKGGVGYIEGGARILAFSDAKPIGISFNPNSCNFGGEIESLFTALQKQQEAKRDAIAGAKYASEDAKQAALDKYDAAHEGDSSFTKLQRSFAGLTVSGIAQHYESQSVYFAEPSAKVIEAFRGAGFKIGKDGAFPTGDLYAGISATSGKSAAFGKSELSCGV